MTGVRSVINNLPLNPATGLLMVDGLLGQVDEERDRMLGD